MHIVCALKLASCVHTRRNTFASVCVYRGRRWVCAHALLRFKCHSPQLANTAITQEFCCVVTEQLREGECWRVEGWRFPVLPTRSGWTPVSSVGLQLSSSAQSPAAVILPSRSSPENAQQRHLHMAVHAYISAPVNTFFNAKFVCTANAYDLC